MGEDERALLDAAPAGIFAFRDDGILYAVNATLLDALDYTRTELVGSHVERIFGIPGRIFFQTHLFPLVRMHGRADEIYLELRSKAGDRVPALLNARREEGPGGGVTHCVVVRVRERKKYEDELLRAKKAAEAAHAEAVAANEAKSHYLRSVSHEIRTPINALLGYADLLDLGAGEPMGEKQLGYVERVRSAARHLLTLVNGILDLSKIESGAMLVARREAALRDAVEAAFSLIEPQAGEHGLRLVRPSIDGTDRYLGDPERVIQILVNLASNAVKFTAKGGEVEVACERVFEAPAPIGDGVPGGPEPPGTGRWLRVRVRDTGVGIPADKLDQIFQPFSQVAESDARQGTGLGLAISRELARLMGGELTVRSRPGAGSTFSLWLPSAS